MGHSHYSVDDKFVIMTLYGPRDGKASHSALPQILVEPVRQRDTKGKKSSLSSWKTVVGENRQTHE